MLAGSGITQLIGPVRRSLFAFGVLGLFLGPVILAVTYTLLQHWVSETKEEETEGSAMAVTAED